jgi:uncharacterized protein YkwD
MYHERLRAVVVALAVAAPLSLFAQSKTDMGALAADLERALGAEHVEINGQPARASAAADRPTSSFESAIVNAMNRERAAHGLTPLGVNSRLEAAADDRIADMFDKHYFSHVSPDGIQPWSWVDQRGYDYREVGENLALGYPSADSIVDGWMHSPGHRANILGAHFREVGVAVSQASPTNGYRGPTVVALYGER